MSILVTGVAGFIGYHVAHRLLSRGDRVIGIDNLNPYYDPELKEDRLAALRKLGGDFEFYKLDLADERSLASSLDAKDFDCIVHLAAQAGVRYSLENPRTYISANVAGHLNILELARHRTARHLVYASSSSVYGGNKNLPFRVQDRTDHPISLYAATKRADELMSETYAHLFRVPMTGLRFFTVYGPWGRPDMAMWIFTKKILSGVPIPVFNNGRMRRDFTFVDDVAHGIVACLDRPPVNDGSEKAGGSVAPHTIYNIGNSRSEDLTKVISLLEKACGRKAQLELMPMQPGDVSETYADISAIQSDIGFEPRMTIENGVPRFVEWYRSYHGIA